MTLDSIGGIVGNADLEGTNADTKVKGYGIGLSATAPLAGGTGMFGLAYVDAEQADSVAASGEFDLTRWIVSAGYDYPFSKRTDVYAVASYMNDDVESKGANTAADWNPSAYTVMVGLRHKF